MTHLPLVLRLKLRYVESIVVKNLIRVRLAAQAQRPVLPKILVDTGHLMPKLVSICDDLAACAVLLPGKWRTGVTVFLDRLVQIAVPGALPEVFLVEKVLKLLPGYLNDSRLMFHESA